MAAAQHKLSRRDVLAGACAVTWGQPIWLSPAFAAGWTQSEGKRGQPDRLSPWQKALARYARAAAGLEAVGHTEDDDLYDRALGRHNAALARLLRAAAPDLEAVAEKLDFILRHSVFELSFGEASLAALRRDVRRFAGLASRLRASA